MKFQLLTDKTQNKKTDCLVLGVCEKTGLAADGMALDDSLSKLVNGLIKAGDIKGKTGETLIVPTPGNAQTDRLLLIGLGEKAKLNAKAWRKAVRAAASAVNKCGAKSATNTLAQLAIEGRDAAWAVTQLTMETANA